MSSATKSALGDGPVTRTRAGRAARPAPRERVPLSDAILDHYFKRLDPQVAAGFTEEQREAIRVLLGLRGIVKHTVEVRRSVPFGRRRFYLVFLLGAEKRTLARLYSEGMVSWAFNVLVYLGLAAGGFVALVGLLKGLGIL